MLDDILDGLGDIVTQTTDFLSNAEKTVEKELITFTVAPDKLLTLTVKMVAVKLEEKTKLAEFRHASQDFSKRFADVAVGKWASSAETETAKTMKELEKLGNF